jgi:hypothetical protein
VEIEIGYIRWTGWYQVGGDLLVNDRILCPDPLLWSGPYNTTGILVFYINNMQCIVNYSGLGCIVLVETIPRCTAWTWRVGQIYSLGPV